MCIFRTLSVISIVLLALCFGATSLVAQERNTADADKPNFRDPRLLIVMIYPDGKLALNKLPIEGTTYLREKLIKVFEARLVNGVYTDEMWNRNDAAEADRVAKGVWVLAAFNLSSEKIDAVVEVIKFAGASPIKMLTDASYQKMLDEPPSPPEPLVTPVKSKVKVRGKKSKVGIITRLPTN